MFEMSSNMHVGSIYVTLSHREKKTPCGVAVKKKKKSNRQDVWV